MQKVIDVLGELFLRASLFIRGVRFYVAPPVFHGDVVCEFKHVVTDSVVIYFQFQRVPCDDYILKRGNLQREAYLSHVVTALFPKDIPDVLQELNGKPFFFNGSRNGFIKDEERTLRLIADIYLDFLKSQMLIAEYQEA